MIDDVPYIGTTIPAGRRVTLGAPVKGISPRCNDGGGPEPDVDAQVASIAGVPVAVAVVEPNAPQAVYLAPGYLPDLASHPLQELLHGGKRRWIDARDRRRCRDTAHVSGILDERDVLTGTLKTHGTIIAVDGRTDYHGPLRNGLPYLTGGEHLDVRGKRCRHREFLIADRVEVSR